LAGGGAETFAAVFVFVDAFLGGELVAVGSLLRGLDGFFSIEYLLEIDRLRGNLEPVEKAGSFLEIDAAVDDGVADAGDGELDGGSVLRRGQLEGPVLEVRLCADGVGLGMVVAELVAPEGRRLAAEPVDFDVPANHVHVSYSPLPPFFR